MVLKRFLFTLIIASFAVFICGFLLMQGIAVVGEGLFSLFGILLFTTVIFNELTAVSL